jgi:ketosteroid isomerase-like protein
MNKAKDEAEIRELMDDLAKAIHARDVDAAMSLHAPEVLTFDVVPPLSYEGAEAYRKSIERWFESYAGPISFETPELSVTVADDVAFSHGLARVSGSLKIGETDYWVRRTTCFRKIDGKWLIFHEHISFPVQIPGGDLQSGKIAVLTP